MSAVICHTGSVTSLFTGQKISSACPSLLGQRVLEFQTVQQFNLHGTFSLETNPDKPVRKNKDYTKEQSVFQLLLIEKNKTLPFNRY